MDKQTYIKEFKELLDKMYEITNLKNADYANDGNVFMNFDLIETLSKNRISSVEGILVRMSDKIQRIANLIYKSNDVPDEKIEDTLVDLANYSLILNLYLKQNGSRPKTISKNNL